ncbi:MAG: ABC-type transport system periplasmic component [uncultured Sphingomonadaceae bacterium]|uniref:ABC-type transport system periplasmic component n=1 Tax=uncultured Sphingomonadaceae bacterium TaxID=169976 RepID=A0A6J4T2W0_9SPHN|nr:MAG: ABC-type transport system periplasmic component [uncultured Sphingomonadaceae bacterium]
METRSNHLLVGGVVLALIALALGIAVWLSQVNEGGEKQYDVLFNQDVTGLARGSVVAYSGVPVGQVREIRLVPNNPQFVRVRIGVEENTPVVRGTEASIQSLGFTGVSQITLDGGTSGAPPLVRPGPFGVPVIPSRPGGINAILASAPELVERVSTLTERLTELLSARNQESIAGILGNTEVISGELAARSDEIAATLAEARIAVQQTGLAAEQFAQLANSSQRVLDAEGQPLVRDLRATVQAAQGSVAALDAAVADARPGLQAFSKQTIPEAGLLISDLRETAASLNTVAQRLETGGATAILGAPKLPNYRERKRK